MTETAFQRFLRTGSPEDAKADMEELEAHHASHRERMARDFPDGQEPSDTRRLAQSIEHLAQAIEAAGVHAEIGSAGGSAVGTAIHHALRHAADG